jgi:hypothetical protein
MELDKVKPVTVEELTVPTPMTDALTKLLIERA